MNWLRKLLKVTLPEDKSDQCGYGIFKLSADHPFTPACKLHDWEFSQAELNEPDKTLDKADWDLFYRWVMIANNASVSDTERCKLAMEICKLWPLARTFGGLLWEGDPKNDNKTN